MLSRAFAITFCVLFAVAVRPRPADAIPVFAHTYGVSCQTCHTTVPHLNEFGEYFRDHGYRMPGKVTPHDHFPAAIKVNLQYSGESDPTGLPKGVVDEVEVLLGGTISKHLSYWAETYVIDGGVPGATRDAFVTYFGNPDARGRAVRVTAGQFTLPLPVDPETFRETINHYAVFDQTVGSNPFSLFEPHQGIDAAFGNPKTGWDVHFVALAGHDKQSGLPSQGVDRMAFVQRTLGPVTLSAYRYDGDRLAADGTDRFWRQGWGASLASHRAQVDLVLQNGFDADADGAGTAFHSSGGFAQLRWEFNPAMFAVVRYDGTSDTAGLARTGTFSLSRRLSRNTRFTVEDVLTHGDRTKHTLNTALLFAY